MKAYAIDIMGQSEPTYISEEDVVKLVKNTNKGAKLVLVGKTFINPSSISRIRRIYSLDISIIEKTDQALVDAINAPDYKQLK